MSDVLVIVEIGAVRDQAALKSYQLGAREQIGRHGGTVLARGGSPFEGSPPFGPVLVQKWPSEQAFRAWQESAEYQPLRELRRACADLRIAVVPLT
jgi:uncharacterized protein (DUF1330 family)